METINVKMQELAKQATQTKVVAKTYEGAKKELVEQKRSHETDIATLKRQIGNFEEKLDSTNTKTVIDIEKFAKADRAAREAEAELSGLVRRVQLLEEETTHMNAKLSKVVGQLKTIESTVEENERDLKKLESSSIITERKADAQEAELEKALKKADEATSKSDDIERRLKVAEVDLIKQTERGEKFELHTDEYEAKLAHNLARLKELEDASEQIAEQEDDYYELVRELGEDLKDHEARALYAEQTVETLERGIDSLRELLFCEQAKFNDISQRLDANLNNVNKV